MEQLHFFQLRLKSMVAVWHSPKLLAVNKDDGCGADLTNGFIQICFGSFIILLGSLSLVRGGGLHSKDFIIMQVYSRGSQIEIVGLNNIIEIVSADSCFS